MVYLERIRYMDPKRAVAGIQFGDNDCTHMHTVHTHTHTHMAPKAYTVAYRHIVHMPYRGMLTWNWWHRHVCTQYPEVYKVRVPPHIPRACFLFTSLKATFGLN